MRRQLRFAVIVLGLAIAAATGAAAMGEALGASAEDPDGSVTIRGYLLSQRLREASMEYSAALQALRAAEARYEAGVGPADDVRERELDVMRAGLALDEVRAMEK